METIMMKWAQLLAMLSLGAGWVLAIPACTVVGLALYRDPRAALAAVRGRPAVATDSECVVLTQTSLTASLDQRFTVDCTFTAPGEPGPRCQLVVTDRAPAADTPTILVSLVTRQSDADGGILSRTQQLAWPQTAADMRPAQVIGVPAVDASK
jgi:hypothetical protein